MDDKDTGADAGTGAKSDEAERDVTRTTGEESPENPAGTPDEEASAAADQDAVGEESADADPAGLEAADQEGAPARKDASAGVGQGAAAVVSAGLGLISLSGSWLGTVAQARESLFGQLETAADASVGTQIQEVYGDSWNANALVAGVFALVALIVGVVVLVRPAFGAPDRSQAPWIKSVAWAGVSLGVIGLVLAALKYTDILLSMPTG
ncbi:hypothetical protein GCM10010365_01560 [Streptomyces poonensis]|uniref:Uncharacterized protein n=1 Tax=Streptomyces poonensis TaxID=68255 RepID=A0A918P7B8_9ACTN|nr:hypothetical protein GCM10010365_01560 [Streptomyces poonensis]GLJ90196.1 hypothetical protein GCM10017589_27990 [Streptomyces poonensis]